MTFKGIKFLRFFKLLFDLMWCYCVAKCSVVMRLCFMFAVFSKTVCIKLLDFMSFCRVHVCVCVFGGYNYNFCLSFVVSLSSPVSSGRGVYLHWAIWAISPIRPFSSFLFSLPFPFLICPFPCFFFVGLSINLARVSGECCKFLQWVWGRAYSCYWFSDILGPKKRLVAS